MVLPSPRFFVGVAVTLAAFLLRAPSLLLSPDTTGDVHDVHHVAETSAAIEHLANGNVSLVSVLTSSNLLHTFSSIFWSLIRIALPSSLVSVPVWCYFHAPLISILIAWMSGSLAESLLHDKSPSTRSSARLLAMCLAAFCPVLIQQGFAGTYCPGTSQKFTSSSSRLSLLYRLTGSCSCRGGLAAIPLCSLFFFFLSSFFYCTNSVVSYNRGRSFLHAWRRSGVCLAGAHSCGCICLFPFFFPFFFFLFSFLLLRLNRSSISIPTVSSQHTHCIHTRSPTRFKRICLARPLFPTSRTRAHSCSLSFATHTYLAVAVVALALGAPRRSCWPCP